MPEFLHVLVSLVVKHSSVFFGWFALFLRNTKTKYQSVHNERNDMEQKNFFFFFFSSSLLLKQIMQKTQGDAFLLN